MRISVVSGKGGVGKSMIASSLAILIARNFEKRDLIAIDCDVDAPNLALWLGIDNSDSQSAVRTQKISTAEKPRIDYEKCTGCEKCVEACNFGALRKRADGKPELVPYRCEGCGLCEIVCPEGAIKMHAVDNCTMSLYLYKEIAGEVNFASGAEGGDNWSAAEFPVIQGQIEPGEAESGESVTEIRKFAETLAENKKMKDVIYLQDAAAGIGCPVIASVVGSDYVVAVAEPSKSSFSDLRRALEVVDNFGISFGVVINKADLNDDISGEISEFAGDRLLGQIKYNPEIIKSIVNLEPVVNTCDNVRDEMEKIVGKIIDRSGISL